MGCTVFTYLISEGNSAIDLPIGSRILGIMSQQTGSIKRDADALLHVLAPDSTITEKRHILLQRSGEEIGYGMNSLAYLGTAVCRVIRGFDWHTPGYQADVVYHLFEVAPE